MCRKIIERLKAREASAEDVDCLMSDLNCRIENADLPLCFHSKVISNGEGYIIVLNSYLDKKKKAEALAHELLHLYNNDFQKGKILFEKENI